MFNYTQKCLQAQWKQFVPLIWCFTILTAHAAPEGADSARERFEPVQAPLPVSAPEGAKVLFGGKPNHEFMSMAGDSLNWPVVDGAMISEANRRRSNHAISRLHFRDADVHVEFKLPEKSDGNSGVYLQGLYEIQILNSTGKEPLGDGDMGAIYGIKPPAVDAGRPPGEWQVLDVRFRPPRRDRQGKIIHQGSITAWLNGKRIHDRQPLGAPKSRYNPYRYDTTEYLQTIWRDYSKTERGPLVLQDHDAPVAFRNVWVKPLDDQAVWYSKSQ